MKVKLLVSLVGSVCYAPGDIFPCASEAEAESLVAIGYAEHIEPQADAVVSGEQINSDVIDLVLSESTSESQNQDGQDVPESVQDVPESVQDAPVAATKKK